MKKEDLVKEVYDDPLFKNIAKDLNEEDRAKIDASLQAFVNDILGPMIEGFEKIADDPEAKEELKRQLRNAPKEVVKK